MKTRPFRGWRYAEADLTGLIAPPYDVLSAHDKDILLAHNPMNIVAIDLPHVPPKELGPDEEYEQAAQLLRNWQRTGVLLQEEEPAFYVYRQTYTWAGKTHQRRSLLIGVRATPFGEDVIPHEHTFEGPKADRMKLTTVTLTQMSPIFGFYNDPSEGLMDRLMQALPEEPDASGELDGVKEEVWAVSHPEWVEEITSLLDQVPVYIADGHHRYTTAMNYRDNLLEVGVIDDDHEANFVMFALVARNEPGLLVLPTHRLVSGLKDNPSAEDLCKALGEAFEVRKLDDTDVDLTDADAFLAPYGKSAMAVLDGKEIWIIRLKDTAPMKEAAPQECEAWQELDVAVLHTLVLDQALSPWKTDATDIDYTPKGEDAKQAVQDGEAQLAVVMQGTPIEAVEAVADAGGSMPHKSTYFYPKLATGIVIKPLR